MIIDLWAKKHGINVDAINDLKKQLSLNTPNPYSLGSSEAQLQAEIRQEASEKGYRLWRNNVGAIYTKEGRFIRYGLANDSALLNKIIKSSDLIGIKPVLITSEHVGDTIGQFLCREIKKPNWTYRGTLHERAQLKWIELIISLGGDAAFTTKKGDL